jgi:hypothetical protein
MNGARVLVLILSGCLAMAVVGCGPRAGGGGDGDGTVDGDGQVTQDDSGTLVDSGTCESNCDVEGDIVCSLMGTRVKACSAVPPNCLRWEVSVDCAAVGMLCDASSIPPVCYSPPTCSDGLMNQDETDVDCGGGCPDCAAGADCQDPEDCESGLCEGGFCLLCGPGTYRCVGNWLEQCDTDGMSWLPDTHCVMTSGVGCDAEAGACHALTPIGNDTTNPTGWYYQFAYFDSSTPALQGNVYDVDAFGDHVFVNRDGAHVDVYHIELLDSDGDGDLEPNQHPDNPDHTGPIEERVITYVQTYDVPTGGVHQEELYVTADFIYFLGNGAISSFDRVTSAVTTIVTMPASGYSGAYETMGFNEVSGSFFFGTRDREVYSWDVNAGEWVYEVKYPNLAGSHMDGMEVVVDPNTGTPYVYVTDMTSDFIGQYREDEDGKWTQHNLFQYSQATADVVEGFGFGTLNHFWCAGGSVLYEVGGGNLAQYTEPFNPTNQ